MKLMTKVLSGVQKADAPEVDGLVYIENLSGTPVKVGEFIKVTITHSDEYVSVGNLLIINLIIFYQRNLEMAETQKQPSVIRFEQEVAAKKL